MIRGTTPTHTFNIPFDISLVDKIKIIYAQKGSTVLIKEKKDCNIDGSAVTVKLTQEETFLFSSDIPCKIQIRILTTGGDAVASKIKTVGVDELLDEEVI